MCYVKNKKRYYTLNASTKYDYRMLVVSEAIAKGIIDSSDKVAYSDNNLENAIKKHKEINKLRMKIKKKRKTNYKSSVSVSDYFTYYGDFAKTLNDAIKKQDEPCVDAVRDLYIGTSIVMAFLNIEKEHTDSKESKELFVYAENLYGATHMLLVKYIYESMDEISDKEKDQLNEIKQMMSSWPEEKEVINEIKVLLIEFLDFFLKTVSEEVIGVLSDIKRMNEIVLLEISPELKKKMFFSPVRL